jgi:2-oxoglutarate dehydrogenase E1 component
MAHRGRLNVLANILNKSYAHIFTEFEDYYTPDLMESTGDVKYHKGFIGNLATREGVTVQVTLTANPSHLESVDAVVEGLSRAKQELTFDKDQRKRIVPILVHGDAALAGQGVVYETMQMSKLNGYATGGTVHIVINNQIGFTTLPKDTRSTRYCTDIAKAFGAPVFHVNAENPEECVVIAQLAIEMRQQFQCDVFIDLNCYRKYGHNESDEPTFTQPHEYQIIKNKKPIRELYREQLIQEGVLNESQAKELEEQFKNNLQQALDQAKSFGQNPPATSKNASSRKEDLFASVDTRVSESSLVEMSEKFCHVPEGFNLHPKIQRLFQDRLNMVRSDPSKRTIDWGMGEYLAYASLLWEGKHVRLSGQDSRRGTFTHRHAIWIDQVKDQKYFPLSHLKKGQGLFDVFNSHLSEFAVLGFEFGYTLGNPGALVIWEAQFGDFANGAQVIIDQYLSSSEQKWTHSSSLVLMLPHGLEGQGPEHSSARMERFLQLCGDDNLQIVNCSTPAQLFHVLRRQMLRTVRKPLVIFTPKALLRHPECISALKEFSTGSFQEVIDDPSVSSFCKKLFFCSGKVYYDLIAEKEKRKASDIAFVRLEQLYPFPLQKVKDVIQKYSQAQDVAWVQEEHSNSGAWEYIRPILEKELESKKLRYVGRPRSASPAAGSHALHKKQLLQMMEEAFKG